jgi:site-specific DNA-methyltransferase (adenine-specific)
MFDWNIFDREKRPWQLCRCDAVRTLATIPDESIDAIVTDPPYGIDLKLKSRRRANSIAGDGKLAARLLWRRWIPEAYRIAKPDTAHVIFGTWRSPWMLEELSKFFQVKGCIVWDKVRRNLYGYHLRPRWELAYLCTKGRAPRRIKEIHDVWSIPRLVRTQHPCEKPVPLLRQAIELVSDRGQLVADLFAGIGSTGVAAMECDRRFLGMEIDRRFAARGNERLNALGKIPDK